MNWRFSGYNWHYSRFGSDGVDDPGELRGGRQDEVLPEGTNEEQGQQDKTNGWGKSFSIMANLFESKNWYYR